VLAISHRANDRRKCLELGLLRRQERRALKERKDAIEKMLTLTYHVNHCSIFPTVGLDVAATPEPLADQLEHLASVAILADMKLRDKLKPVAARWITIDGDCKAALTIHIARDVAIQPFLLIVRTRHIFTVPPDGDGTRSAGYSEFPAYSRIFRQQRNLLSHDVLNPARVPL